MHTDGTADGYDPDPQPPRVLMLGWEFPPVISGGLGTACYWLTRALSDRHVRITFVMPTDPGLIQAGQVRLLWSGVAGSAGDRGVSFRGVPSFLTSPYPGGLSERPAWAQPWGRLAPEDRPIGILAAGPGGDQHREPPRYSGNLVEEVSRFANQCVRLAAREKFDVIHAHDWVTFPAALAISAATGKPMIAHVHSTEFDRAGAHSNRYIFEIERRGVHGAMGVIAVSHLTKSMLVHRYQVPPDKITVIYNGIDTGDGQPAAPQADKIDRRDKIVLFLGRITMQKGPEYFVEAAKKVLDRMDGVKFVMAGSGDRVGEVIELAAARGIGHKVLFTGFLHGRDVQRVLNMADLYVMPSVSEPFGIAPLEAIRHDVPVIISKTSGVSEVLSHALKVDFWDTDDIANKILAILRHPPLGNTLREEADLEIRGLTWAGAAKKCCRVYEQVAAAAVC